MQDFKVANLHTTRLWVGFIGSPAIWVAHFMTVWALVEGGCFSGLGDRQISGVNAVQFTVLAASMIGLVLTGGVGWIAYRNWQSVRSTDSTVDTRVIERVTFMAVIGMLFSIIFFVVIFVSTLPVFVLPPCDL